MGFALRIKMEGLTWSDHVLDHFIAPELSKITTCGASDIDQPPDYLIAFILSAIFIAKHEPEDYSYLINMIRRTEQAVREYISGRQAILEFLPVRNQRPWRYFGVLHHFEQCVALSDQAIRLAQEWHHRQAQKQNPKAVKELCFLPQDGSHWERLNMLHADWKHSDERINKGKLPPNGTVTVWITDEGLKSCRAYLRFSELREILNELMKSAK